MHNIEAYVGPNGSGKTLAAVQRCVLPAWADGRPVVGNLTLKPEAVDLPPELFKPLSSWRQIPRLGKHLHPDGTPVMVAGWHPPMAPAPQSVTDNIGCVLFLDEITSCLPSRQAMSLPVELQRVLNQLRKHDVQLVWTAPDWRRCDTILREVTQAVTVCRGHLPDKWQREPVLRRFPPKVRQDGKPVPVEGGWLPNRRFIWTTYDAQDFEAFTVTTQQRLTAMGTRRYWRSMHRAQFAYDSTEAVNLLDHLDEGGKCLSCGGSRPRRKCECGEDPPARRASAEDGASRTRPRAVVGVVQ